MLYDQLRNFSALQILNIEFENLKMSKIFFDGVSELLCLKELKLKFTEFDLIAFRAWSLKDIYKVNNFKSR
jgi:hypothetical protein